MSAENQSLWQLSLDQKALNELLFELDGDVSGQEEAFTDMKKELEDKSNAKMNSYGWVLRRLANEEDFLRIESQRLQKKAQRLANIQKEMKALILKQVELRGDVFKGVPSIKTEHFVFTTKKSPPALNILNPELVPQDYIIQTREISKSMLKDFVKEIGGELVDDDGVVIARLEQNTTLQIK